jgi:uncharacterized membrane protein YphA (DoxX/SURF4 family)
MNVTSVTAVKTARPKNLKNALLWGVQIVLAAVFVFAAAGKLAGEHSAVQMFGQIGAGQWLRYFVGAAELGGAIGLLIRPLTALAAAGLAVDMAGASVINVGVLHSAAVALTVPLCAVLALVCWTRRPAVRAADIR